jgi:thiol-disulfide isomerase/thioredoxin
VVPSSDKHLYANEGEELEKGIDAETSLVGESRNRNPLLCHPCKPSEKEVDEHNASHIPFRDWCPACVRGRGKSVGHYAKEHEEDQVPVVTVDYGFFGSDGIARDGDTPTLVVKDRKSKNTWGHPVQHKGVNDYAVGKLVEDLNNLGYKKVVLKSDQEPAIVALCRQAKANFQGEVVPEASPKGESQSNGEIERAVQAIEGQARTLKEHLEQKAGWEIKENSPILMWLIEHAGTLINLFHVGVPHDGKTAYQRIRGRKWTVALPQFGEAVEFKRKTNQKLDVRWERGVFLGVKESTTEKIVGNAGGTYTVQSVRRLPLEQQFSAELLQTIVGLPWKPNPKAEGADIPDATRVRILPECPEIPRQPVMTEKKEYAMRRFYLTKTDLEKHGYTPGCPACEAIRVGKSRAGIFHTDGCRQRLEAKIAEDPTKKRKLEEHEKRFVDEAARRGELINAEQVAVAPANPGGAASSSGINRAVPEAPDDEMLESRKRPAGDEAPDSGRGDPVPDDDQVMSECLGSMAVAENLLNELVIELHEKYLYTVRKAGNDKPVCEEPIPDYSDEDYEDFDCIDDVSGKCLNSKLVNEARKLEIKFFEDMGLWKVIKRPVELGEYRLISTRWVDVNKGDEDKPNYRSRFVAREIKKNRLESFFAAMPPLTALRMLVNFAVTDGLPDKDRQIKYKKTKQVLSFVDISRAHIYPKCRRKILIELPEELGLGPGYVGELVNQIYGLRDAGQLWEGEILRVMTLLGFDQGVSSPCVYYHPVKDIKVEVHGDDFTNLGDFYDLQWLHTEMAKHWTLKVRGILGPPGMEGCTQSITNLNRIITWTSEGIEWEADPRHADLIVKSVGVTGCKVSTPGVKEKVEVLEDENEELDLSPEEAKIYRSTAMRAAYLSQDRPDIQVPCRELAKGLKDPKQRHWTMLKHLARYLKNKPRLVQLFRYQHNISEMVGWADSNHAGCIRTRKSTSGGAVMIGSNMIITYTRGQAVIALSSGEAEYYGLVSCISQLFGEISLAKDWQVMFTAKVWMDATAGIAIGSRRGLGRVKHIDTMFLWVQQVVNEGRVKLGKKDTTEMLADIMTKHVPEGIMLRMLDGMGFRFAAGRHNLGLKA